MLRRIGIILLIILIGIGIWLWITASKALQAEKDLEARFNDVTQFYVGLNQQYVLPLSGLSTITPSEQQSLAKISADLDALAKNTKVKERIDALLLAQHDIIQFFTGSVLSEFLISDPRYVHWNNDSTNRGMASTLVFDYNQALITYKARNSGIIKHILRAWPTWPNPNLLGINGETQETTRIDF